MSWAEDNLQRHLDEHGDIAPPWEKFPEYERYTIGWRMGSGESWLMLWSAFLEGIPDADERLAYLKRHAPAPFSWASSVADVLTVRGASSEDDLESEWYSERKPDYASLYGEGLIRSDIAFRTWAAQQSGLTWPWDLHEEPITAARHWTRGLYFATRQIAEAEVFTVPDCPPAWNAYAAAFQTAQFDATQARSGLELLALQLCAGRISPPWELGLEVDDFEDSFEDDMGYVDAFRLWTMAAFDDLPHWQRYVEGSEAPGADWKAWIDGQVTEMLPDWMPG